MIIFILIVLIAILGAPLFTVIGLTAIVNFLGLGEKMIIVPQEIAGIVNTPLLYSIPLFTFAGYLLAHSNASQRLVKLTKSTLGWMPGGLAIVTLLTCSVFTAFTGASGVTIVALGGLLLPALLSEKYGERYSLGLVTTSGSIGLLFPPSLPIILFGVVAGASIDKLFVAGIVPGILLILVLSIHAMFMGTRYKVKRVPFSWGELKDALWLPEPTLTSEMPLVEKIKTVIKKIQFWEIPLPILLFSGVYSGKLVISDAASFTVMYLLVVELFLTKDIKIKDLPKIMIESMILVGSILIILSVSLAATNYIVYAQVPQKIFGVIKQFITNKWLFLILLNVLLLIVGCIMDIFSALVVVVPLILPIANAYNVNLIHLGIIFLANLEIGYLTPPIGMNLFISSIRFNKPVMTLYRSALIFIGLLFSALMLITYIPSLSTWFLDKPSIVGKWEYRYEDGNIDQIILKSSGKYMRKEGGLMEIMISAPEYGEYTVKGGTLTLKSVSDMQEYKFEIFNNGEKLLLEKIKTSEDELFETDDQSPGEDEYEWLDEGTAKIDDRMFYINLVSPPINEKTGKFIGKWVTDDLTLEFKFNGLVSFIKNDIEQIYRYNIKGAKLSLTEYSEEHLENPEKLTYSYKFKNGTLMLKTKDRNLTLNITDSLSDE